MQKSVASPMGERQPIEVKSRLPRHLCAPSVTLVLVASRGAADLGELGGVGEAVARRIRALEHRLGPLRFLIALTLIQRSRSSAIAARMKRSDVGSGSGSIDSQRRIHTNRSCGGARPVVRWGVRPRGGLGSGCQGSAARIVLHAVAARAGLRQRGRRRCDWRIERSKMKKVDECR